VNEKKKEGKELKMALINKNEKLLKQNSKKLNHVEAKIK
jgi:hypothetical protein